MKIIKSNTGIQILIAVISALIFVPFLGQVHLFDWDEINFAESAREMIASGNYLTVQIDFEPFWEKPPMFIWMQVVSMKIFGINAFAARLPNAICGVVTLLVLYNIGRKLYNQKFGLIWTLVYAGSFLPFFYFKSGIIDPWFNLFIFLGVYFILRYFHSPQIKYSILSAVSVGLAILTKGPVGFLIMALSAFVFLLIKRFKVKIIFRDVIVYALVLIFVGGFWFLLQILNGNYDIIVDFIEYQIHLFSKEGAGHGGFLLYHFVILLFGVFPASLFAIRGFQRNYDQSLQQQMRLMMAVVFWTVLILFTIVNTKIIHYSSMCYFPLTYLAARMLYRIISGETKPARWVTVAVMTVGSLYALLIAAFPFIGRNANVLAEADFIKDEFAKANLQADVYWSGWESLIGVILIIALIFFVIQWRKSNYMKGVAGLFTGTIILLFTAVTVFTPKIEGYSQNAAVEFYKSKIGKNVYVEPLGFKSYAHYFYTQKSPETAAAQKSDKWLLTGNIDRKAWFVIKVHKLDKYLEQYPELVKHSEKNGFVFCYRNPEN